MAEEQKGILASVIENFPALLVALAVILLIIASASAVTYKEVSLVPGSPIYLLIGSIILFIAAVILYLTGTGRIYPSHYGFKITSPNSNDAQRRKITVNGIFLRMPPKGYQVRLLRIYPKSGDYYPMSEAHLNANNKTWEAFECDLGGDSGDKRIIGVYLVGELGQKFLRYFKQAESVHGVTRKVLVDTGKNGGDFLPLLPFKTPDMYECDRLTVTRAD